MNTFVRKARRSDIEEIATRIRLEDALEAWRLRRQTPMEALLEAFAKSSLVFCFCIGERPAALFGVAPDTLSSPDGCIWLLGTDDINRCKVAYYRACRKWVERLLEIHPCLYNLVDVEYTKAHAWLLSLGAQEGQTLRQGTGGEEFKLFTFWRS